MDLEFEIQLFIESHQKSNGNKCGLNPIEIMKKFSIDKKTLIPIIIKLKNKILIREGVNNKLIFLKK